MRFAFEAYTLLESLSVSLRLLEKLGDFGLISGAQIPETDRIVLELGDDALGKGRDWSTSCDLYPPSGLISRCCR